MDEYDMFMKLLEYADKNELYDKFGDLELEWGRIKETEDKIKFEEWRIKVRKIYNELINEGGK